jgi:pyruvate kinase
LPALEKAAAIITEEPGVTSHAATKGLELDIPVIVGVSEAVSSLETNDTVTVDSIRGLIYKGEAKVL